MAQEQANTLPYKERYSRYLAWHKAQKRDVKPYSYDGWLKYYATANVPPDCRPGQGKEARQQECQHFKVNIPESSADNKPFILTGICAECGRIVEETKQGWVAV